MGAGILPICTRAGTICVLLGQERHDQKWSDFGGSKNPGETYIKTALREGEEELNGILGTGRYLSELVKNNYVAEIDNGDSYSSFVFKIKYDNRLPQYFNNNNIFIEKKQVFKNDTTHIELKTSFQVGKVIDSTPQCEWGNCKQTQSFVKKRWK